MQTFRTFIALELTSEIHDELDQLQQKLKAACADVNWVNPRGIHLTLKFLGSISLELIEEVKKTVEAAAKTYSCFTITLAALGAFPNQEYPRVIWVGIEDDNKSKELAEDLKERLINLGFLPEKRDFNPHLTLGRARSSANRENLKELLTTLNVKKITTKLRTITVFKSTLTPSGAIYEPLFRQALC